MLIYLDTMVVQYIITYFDFVFARMSGYPCGCPVTEPKLRRELVALQELMFLEQLGRDWVYACSPHLWKELNAGKLTAEQRESYPILKRSWEESAWTDAFPLNEVKVLQAEDSLKPMHLDSADRRHLAEAIVLNASWFLTNDATLIKRAKRQQLRLRVARPSECLNGMSVGLFLK